MGLNTTLVFSLIFLATSLILSATTTCYARSNYILNPIQLATNNADDPIRLATDNADDDDVSLNCLSWRLAVETNNLKGWKTVPEHCGAYIAFYMLVDQYDADCDEVADAAIEYAKTIKVGDDGKDIWIFDIDDTMLSNIPYYGGLQFGVKEGTRDMFYDWVAQAKSKPVAAVLRLYKEVLKLNIKPVILTASAATISEKRELNLKNAGYDNWERLIFKPIEKPEERTTAAAFKSKMRTQLVNDEGCRIVGNIGDQHHDLLGPHAGIRTFKVPNPMYAR